MMMIRVEFVPGANIDGATFRSYMTYSAAWDACI